MKGVKIGALLIFVFAFFAVAQAVRLNKKGDIYYYDKGEKKTAFLGVLMTDLDRELREEIKTRARYGAFLKRVVENSPAQRAGLEEGDIIVKFDRQTIRKADDLRELLRKYQPNDRVKVEVWRDRERKIFQVELGSQEEYDFPFNQNFTAPLKLFQQPYVGLKIQDLDDDLAEYFDIDQDEGVLVTDVEEESPAEEADLKSGDIITRIDGEKVSNTGNFDDIIADLQENDQVRISYIRQGETKRTTLKVEFRDNQLKDFYKLDPDQYQKYHNPNTWNWFRFYHPESDKELPFKEDIEEKIEQRISEQVEKRISEEIEKSLKELNEEIEALKDEIERLKEELR